MVAQFGRQYSIIVSPPNGQGLELNEFHCTFRISHANVETPTAATVRVYNLADATAQQIQKEFTALTIRAGYQGNYGIIFSGTATRINNKGGLAISKGDDVHTADIINRSSPTDTYLEIYAADGDKPYNWGIINTTLAAGYKPNDVNKAIAAAGGPLGLLPGDLPSSVAQTPAPRGKACYGLLRGTARDLANTNALTWGINQGMLEWLPQSAFRPGDAIVLTSDTGLVGYPQLTESGLSVRCLLNPAIAAGSRIKIDNKSIQQPNPSFAAGALNVFPSTQADGFYKVIFVDYLGDTRGEDWYCDMVCLSIDPTAQQPVGSGAGQVLGVPIPP